MILICGRDSMKKWRGCKKQKKFGLVFEEHLPEATPLYRDYLDNFSINYERN